MTKQDALDLIESPMWEAYLKVTFSVFKAKRQSLLVNHGLTQETRIHYTGQLLGVVSSLQEVYKLAGEDLPPRVAAFFKGEWSE